MGPRTICLIFCLNGMLYVSNLNVSWCHVSTIPPQAILTSLVQGTLQLGAQPLGVLSSLVLGHSEEDSSSIGGYNKTW